MGLGYESHVVWKEAEDFRQIGVLQTTGYCNHIPLHFKCGYINN